MLTNPEPDRNIDELNDDEIYAAIRYLELLPGRANKHSDAARTLTQCWTRPLQRTGCSHTGAGFT
jgi:hypothetical protein